MSTLSFEIVYTISGFNVRIDIKSDGTSYEGVFFDAHCIPTSKWSDICMLMNNANIQSVAPRGITRIFTCHEDDNSDTIVFTAGSNESFSEQLFIIEHDDDDARRTLHNLFLSIEAIRKTIISNNGS